MTLPAEYLLKPVPGDEDLFAFNYDFNIEAKALDDGTPGTLIEELEDGDLIIEGYAAEFDGADRQGENFTDGAFQRGIKSFLDKQAALCYHHEYKKVLGKVLELEEEPGRGLRMRARVDGAIKDHPDLGVYYKQIKKGTLNGLSVGGFFRRKLTPDGRKISNCDFTEISVTGVPVHTKPMFSVVAGKALEDASELDLGALSLSLDEYESVLSQLAEGKAVKGDPQDLYFLALVLKLEQFTNSMATSDETEGELGEGGGPTDSAVDALIEKTKDTMDEIAREAHKLAAKLGPLPTITYS